MKLYDHATPRVMRRRLKRLGEVAEELRDAADRVADEVMWVYNYGHTPTQARGEPTSGGGPGDPTWTATADRRKRRARRAYEAAADRVRTAESKLRDAVAELKAADDILKGATAIGDMAPAPGHYPRTVSSSELAEARAAQQRRMARGEGWGDG